MASLRYVIRPSLGWRTKMHSTRRYVGTTSDWSEKAENGFPHARRRGRILVRDPQFPRQPARAARAARAEAEIVPGHVQADHEAQEIAARRAQRAIIEVADIEIDQAVVAAIGAEIFKVQVAVQPYRGHALEPGRAGPVGMEQVVGAAEIAEGRGRHLAVFERGCPWSTSLPDGMSMQSIRFDPRITTDLQLDWRRPDSGQTADLFADLLKRRFDAEPRVTVQQEMGRREIPHRRDDPAGRVSGRRPDLVIAHAKTLRGEAKDVPGPDDRLLSDKNARREDAQAALARSSRHSHQATPPTTSAPPAICAGVGAWPPTASSVTATIGTRLV